MFDFARFCEKYRIGVAPQSDRHAREGWINVQCPFCQHPHRYHLGFRLSSGYFRCWRCGKHDVVSTVAALSGVGRKQAKEVIRGFQDNRRNLPAFIKEQEERAETCFLPSGTYEIEEGDSAWKYLVGTRGLDPKVINEWDLSKTHPASNYPNRIVVPFYYGGTIVTWQLRDFTGKKELPWFTNPKANAVLDVKEMVYGGDEATDFQKVVVVEGAGDVWNIGYGAVATNGTRWTNEQALMLSQWREVFIMFDQDDPTASKHAHSLGKALTHLGTETNIMEYDKECDPGEFSREEIIELRKEIFGGEL